MALTERADDTAELVPRDTFRLRIAMIRTELGWNYSAAARHTGIKAENWRLWEKTERKPHDYEAVCRQIADATGYSLTWIKSGGPLRSRCSAQLSSVPLPEGLRDQLSWLDERGEPWEPPSVAAV